MIKENKTKQKETAAGALTLSTLEKMAICLRKIQHYEKKNPPAVAVALNRQESRKCLVPVTDQECCGVSLSLR